MSVIPESDAAPMIPRLFRVTQTRREREGIRTLHLVPADGTPARAYAPGQFSMLYVFGLGEAAISIAGRGVRDDSLVHTVRAVGAVSEAICNLKRGAMIGVRGPFGSAWPVAQSAGRHVLLIAGGVGLPPLRGALQAIMERRESFGRVSLLVGARAPDLILYRKELGRLRSNPDIHVEITVDRGGPEWHGQVGLVTTLIDRALFLPSNTVAMICGPEAMMRFTVRELQRCGMRDEDIYLSLERNMKCAVVVCGHCQFGPAFVCREGPVFRYDRIRDWLSIREL